MSALTAAGSTRAWRRLRAFVLRRDGNACQLPMPGGRPATFGGWAASCAPATAPRDQVGRVLVCGAYADHADHVLARNKGGTDDPANVRALCESHNLQLGDRGQLPTPAPRRQTKWSW